MKGESFQLEIATPLSISQRDVLSLRLKDETGFFGIMKSHCDFIAILVPALGYFISSNGNEHFLAVDGGVFMMRDGKAFLTSGEIFESQDVRQLSGIIDNTLARRDAAEQAIARMVEGIEHSFLEKSTALSRGRTDGR